MMQSTSQKVDKSHFHHLQPDYTGAVFNFPETSKNKIKEIIQFLYGENCSNPCYRELERIIKVYYAHKSPEMIAWEKSLNPTERFTEKDVILITYGDLVRSPGEKPLKTMKELCKKYLHNVFNTIHILPFFPYSSDRGFAVMDFEEVDPSLGNWEDLLDLKSDFKLMFDGVFNHVSSKSRWFQEFLNQNPDFQNFFTVFSTSSEILPDHLKLIVRPRTSDLLSGFDTLHGRRMVWTTFSADQIDLNYRNPRVLFKMVEIMLTYVRRGADIIRLDAVTYLWEELGTTCVHLEQTHAVIKLFREILDMVAPHVALITETNVPHADNVRYFGNGFNEAQMVYNFALPPLVLHTMQNGSSKILSEWATTLQQPSNQTTYFNFLDSHDGIGVMAVKDILSSEDVEIMALRVLEHGGYISYKADGDGKRVPYELNITWFSAINNEDAGESPGLQVKRYIASRAIAFAIIGVPGVYVHGLLGSKNDAELVFEEKETRSINRKNINKEELLKSLESPDSTTFLVTVKLIRMIRKRIQQKAFHPNAPQKIINISDKLFTVLRTSVDGDEHVLAVTNITDQFQTVYVGLADYKIETNRWYDILGRRQYLASNDQLSFDLEPYQVAWLKSAKK